MSSTLKFVILAGAFLVLILAHPLPEKSAELQNSSTEIDTLGSETRVKRQGGCGCGCGCCCCAVAVVVVAAHAAELAAVQDAALAVDRAAVGRVADADADAVAADAEVADNKLAAKLAAEAGNSQESAENLESSAENLPEPVFELVTETSRI
ncbi:unnamed protein product [Caenorhabditis angaria]|uniref:Secreted protein n=1 Tax=Caenorhabditis angaria TaxID=860376 RepID=A0A9P1ITS3_9PELO|nr:unnamed protein product [Caenorhabditis angaria]